MLLAPVAPALARVSVSAQPGARARLALESPSLESQSVQPPSSKQQASATLEQCETAASEDARSATFAGEMTAVAGTERMQISIGILERLPGEATYHAVEDHDLSAWRSSEPGVQSYKYVRQVTNLTAPASYRAAIRFRWLGAKGRPIEALELRTRRCEQPTATLSSQ